MRHTAAACAKTPVHAPIHRHVVLPTIVSGIGQSATIWAHASCGIVENATKWEATASTVATVI